MIFPIHFLDFPQFPQPFPQCFLLFLTIMNLKKVGELRKVNNGNKKTKLEYVLIFLFALFCFFIFIFDYIFLVTSRYFGTFLPLTAHSCLLSNSFSLHHTSTCLLISRYMLLLIARSSIERFPLYTFPLLIYAT